MSRTRTAFKFSLWLLVATVKLAWAIIKIAFHISLMFY